MESAQSNNTQNHSLRHGADNVGIVSEPVNDQQGGNRVGIKTMKKRIFSGAICKQLVYNVPNGVRDFNSYDPEKPRRKRFKDESEYEAFKKKISLRNFIRAFHANFSAGDLYSTLTFDNDWEVHTFEEAKRIRKNYVRALQRKYPDAVIFLVMGRGKGTDRIHFHMVSSGIPQEFVTEKWKYGTVKRFSPLREHNWYGGVDHGQDYTGICIYLFDHWTEEVGGHRWFQTKNAKQPEEEKPTEVRISGGYSEKRPPVAPKGYKLVETKATRYGYLYFKYVAVPQKEPRKKRKNNRSESRFD